MNDIQAQKPFTTNQISNEKPSVPQTEAYLSGYVANSLNGGHNKPISWKKIMAGERHKEMRLKANIQMLTPKTPTYQNLKATVRTFFVPNSRVWKNAEKYTAQRGGASETKIEEIPNCGGKIIPRVYSAPTGTETENEYYTPICNTEMWRDSFISSYYPRIYEFIAEERPSIGFQTTLPKLSVLPLRGYTAIYNDFFRHKEYEESITEFDSDTVSDEEWYNYFPYVRQELRPANFLGSLYLDYFNGRAKRENSYYTDYRTELQGFELEQPAQIENDKELLLWANWESKIAESRSQAENAQMNDWDIISKIRGSRKLTEGKVQLISKKTFNLNYAAITQNTYNNNENVAEEFRVMGKQGAYSYTEIDIPLYAGLEFIEEGYLHVFITVSADTVFEKGFDRNLLNVTPLDEYRPDLEGDKYDVLYEVETTTTNTQNNNVLGFKRKYSEYFKLPNVIAGDMTTDNYYTKENSGGWDPDNQTITQKTFQFFEKDINTFEFNGISQVGKKIWKDYTDLMINKNQAIMNPITYGTDTLTPGTQQVLTLSGQNQIFFVGVMTCNAILPINSEIEGNYTTWGEH